MTQDSDPWSTYWQSESPLGEVFVDPQGDKHPALGEFWNSALAELSSGQRLVDLAAGAGSILASLPMDHGADIHACDTSKAALERLLERFPATSTRVCDAASTPYETASMDWVVSQFGIEYAGAAAFEEAARLLAPGGRFVALVHYRYGLIDTAHRRQLHAAEAVIRDEFIARARELISAAFTTDKRRFDKAADVFIEAERRLAKLRREQPVGVHAHLHTGFRELYERRRQYALADIIGWLEAMEDEVAKAVERLRAIIAVALDEETVAAAERGMTAGGLVWQTAEPFFGTDRALPVAWQLRALRPATQ